MIKHAIASIVYPSKILHNEIKYQRQLSSSGKYFFGKNHITQKNITPTQ